MAILFVIGGVIVAAVAGHAVLNGNPIQGLLFGILAMFMFSHIKNPALTSATDWLLTAFTVVLVISAAITFFTLNRKSTTDNNKEE